MEKRWFDQIAIDWQEQIVAPFCWESLAPWGEDDAAGNNHYYAKRVFRDPQSVLQENHRSALRYELSWYRREVRVPRHTLWANKIITGLLSSVDRLKCWATTTAPSQAQTP